MRREGTCGRSEVGGAFAAKWAAARGEAIRGHAAREDGCEVTVVDLRLREEEYEHAIAVLSEEERIRARKIRSETKRRRFVAAHAAARTRLARELGIAAERVAVRVGDGGKPELGHAGVRKGPSLPRFSISHSGDLAAIAIRRGGEVGVDVEHVRAERRADGRRVEWERLLERICGEREREQAEEDAGRIGARMAFHTRWVAKEAVVKALGCGFRVAPAEVTLRRTGGAFETVGLYGREGGSARCTLLPLEAPHGFVGALALLDSHASIPATCLQGDPVALPKGTIR